MRWLWQHFIDSSRLVNILIISFHFFFLQWDFKLTDIYHAFTIHNSHPFACMITRSHSFCAGTPKPNRVNNTKTVSRNDSLPIAIAPSKPFCNYFQFQIFLKMVCDKLPYFLIQDQGETIKNENRSLWCSARNICFGFLNYPNQAHIISHANELIYIIA